VLLQLKLLSIAPSLSTAALSTPAISSLIVHSCKVHPCDYSIIVHSCIVHSCNFSARTPLLVLLFDSFLQKWKNCEVRTATCWRIAIVNIIKLFSRFLGENREHRFGRNSSKDAWNNGVRIVVEWCSARTYQFGSNVSVSSSWLVFSSKNGGRRYIAIVNFETWRISIFENLNNGAFNYCEKFRLDVCNQS